MLILLVGWNIHGVVYGIVLGAQAPIQGCGYGTCSQGATLLLTMKQLAFERTKGPSLLSLLIHPYCLLHPPILFR
jgi:hypothetical protein